MSVKIVIIDYGMGNLRSVQKAFEKIGFVAIISSDHGTIKQASHIVLPGVGAFGDAMKNLQKLGLVEVLNEEVLQNKKPFLGICLGMQLLADKSYENGEHKGFGWIEGEVVRFDTKENLKVPHVGWNSVKYTKPSLLFNTLSDESDFYFVHSYHFKAKNKEDILSITDYGFDFVSSVAKDNIFGVQFHPEKSQESGLKILQNFVSFEVGIC